jgi:hypothetical protein
MKSFCFLKLPLVMFALGGVLTFAPGARAQSDVAPDHFDGTDSWAASASVQAPSVKPKPLSVAATQQVRSSHSTDPVLKPVAVHELAANKKRKPAARKSANQSY